MYFLDHTAVTAVEDLALDEALLDRAEAEPGREVLRVWEPRGFVVILGRSRPIGRDCDRAACRASGVPVLRRKSGGGTVLLGPGCLAYSLVLDLALRPELRSLTRTNTAIMETIRDALRPLAGETLEITGVTDLSRSGRKVCGNAQMRRRRCLLFHGSLLLDLDLERVGRLLPVPDAQPDYRAGRSHREFMENLGLPRAAVVEQLRLAWDARSPLEELPEEEMTRLASTEYGREEWIART